MSTIQSLRAYVRQRLTVAVEEVMEMFDRTINEYEEEIHRHRRLWGAEQLAAVSGTERMVNNTEAGGSQVVQALVFNAEIPPEQRDPETPEDPDTLEDRETLEDPETLHIKEEPEEVWIRRGLEGADISDFQFPSVSVKSEDDEEKPQSSLLHQREADPPASTPAQQTRGGSEPASDLDVAAFLKETEDAQVFLTQCFKSELDDGTESELVSDTLEERGAVSSRRCPIQKEVYKCPACSKSFQHNAALQRHITCHSGERPFGCTECGKTFRQKGSLHIHMRRHTGERPFCCSMCGKKFSQSGTLAAHMRIHTGEKPFSCSVCQNRYNERGTLVRHMRVHTGEKPFTCSLCGKQFSLKGNLNKHKRIHTREKPFCCSV